MLAYFTRGTIQLVWAIPLSLSFLFLGVLFIAKRKHYAEWIRTAPFMKYYKNLAEENPEIFKNIAIYSGVICILVAVSFLFMACL